MSRKLFLMAVLSLGLFTRSSVSSILPLATSEAPAGANSPSLEERRLGPKESLDEILKRVSGKFDTKIAVLNTRSCTDVLSGPQAAKGKAPPATQSKDATKKCPVAIKKKTFDLVFRYTPVNKSSGGLLIQCQLPAKDQSHQVEFVLKFTVELSAAGATETIDEKSLTLIMARLNEKLNEIVSTLDALSYQEVNGKVLELLKVHYDDVPNYGSSPVCEINLCYLRTIVKPKGAAGGAQSFFEVKVAVLESDPLYAIISVKLGLRNFSIKAPIAGWAEDTERDLKAAFDKLFKDAADIQYQLVEIPEAYKIIQESIKTPGSAVGDCFELASPAKDLQREDSYFYMDLKIKPNDQIAKFPKCVKQERVREVSDYLHIAYFNYQLGALNYGHLFVDSKMQSSEYLIDLSQSSFPASIKEEIKDFTDGLSVEFAKDGSEEVTFDVIIQKIKKTFNQKDFVCAKVGNSANKQLCKLGKDPIIELAYYELETPVFKIKFVYPRKDSPEALQKSGTLTNQIVIQKFNSFNQFDKVEKALANFKKFVATR